MGKWVFLCHILRYATILFTCPQQCGTQRERSAVRLGLYRTQFAIVYLPQFRKLASRRPDVAHICPSTRAAFSTCFCMTHNLWKLADYVNHSGIQRATSKYKRRGSYARNKVPYMRHEETAKTNIPNTSRLLQKCCRVLKMRRVQGRLAQCQKGGSPPGRNYI